MKGVRPNSEGSDTKGDKGTKSEGKTTTVRILKEVGREEGEKERAGVCRKKGDEGKKGDEAKKRQVQVSRRKYGAQGDEKNRETTERA